MKVRSTTFRSRKAWEMDNGEIKLIMLQGGGHIASLTRRDCPGINPMWEPIWKGVEPWQFKAGDKKRYGSRLLAAIAGHNPCLGWFGEPSEAEAACGLEGHGEAPVARWKLEKKGVTKTSVSMTCSCELPVAGMRYTRVLKSRRSSDVIEVTERVKNLCRRDVPFTMCQHVTLGPPFLEKGVTVFDMPATKGHTFPGTFGPGQRLKEDCAFVWPKGPGAKGKTVDLRTIRKVDRVSTDFTVQLMDPREEDAWFSAINPRMGLLLAYAWKRSDYPWVGNWEENRGRKNKPWAGKSLTRGMEFANTPFPVGLKRAVDMGKYQGEPTYRWLPASQTIEYKYGIVMKAVPSNVKGTADIRREGKRFSLHLYA